MDKINVYPAPGVLVRDPVTAGHLPEQGAVVPRNTYWLRRLAEGDVLQAPPAAKKKAKE